MDNNEIREGIISDLLNVLKNQSAYYLIQSQSNDLSLSDRKEIEKELNDINTTLKDVTNVSAVYTIQQLEDLKSLYQQKYNLILEQSQNLEINTLNIQFDSLTPQQKEFLKGQKGDKGENGKSAFEIAKIFGYSGTEIEWLASLKGADGENGLSAFDIAKKNGFIGTEIEWLQSLKGADGQGSNTSIFDFTQVQQNGQTLFDTISDIYAKIGQHAGQLGSLNGNVNDISSNMLLSKINSLFEILMGKYEVDENGNSIQVFQGLLERFEELYAQVNPPQEGGAM